MELVGVRRDKESLFHSIVQQLSRQIGYQERPDVFLSRVRADAIQSIDVVSRHVLDPLKTELQQLSLGITLRDRHGTLDVLFALHATYKYNFRVYSRFTNVFSLESTAPLIQLFHDPPFFDGVQRGVVYLQIERPLTRPTQEIRIATWNLRGATTLDKQNLIDNFVNRQNISILCLQESHLRCSSLQTANYFWHLGTQGGSQRSSRGCGFMIHKEFPYAVKFSELTSNITALDIKFHPEQVEYRIVCVHRVSEGDRSSAAENSTLLGFLRQVPDKRMFLLCGDFNAHIAKDEHLPTGDVLIGKYLHHAVTNTNGRELLYLASLLNLQLVSTMLSHTTRITRAQGSSQSQLDHVLVPLHHGMKLLNMRGIWSRLSDHKLIYFTMMPKRESKFWILIFINFTVNEFLGQLRSAMIRQPPEQRITWDMRYVLRSGEKWEGYEKELGAAFAKQDWSLLKDNTERWGSFCADLIAISKSIYPLIPVGWTDNQRKAKKSYFRELNVFNRLRAVDHRMSFDLDPAMDLPPIVPPDAYGNLISARANMKSLDRERKLLDLSKHIEGMEKLTNVGERVASTYKYLRAYKKVHSARAVTPVTLRDWERVILKVSGESVPEIIEDDYFPMLPLKWFDGLNDVLERSKFDKAPGLDLLGVEMLR